MKQLVKIFLFLLISTATYANTITKTDPVLGDENNPIKVGVLTVSPFGTMVNDDFQGLSIEYWKEIAAIYGWHYKFIDAGQHYKKAVRATNNGTYDILLGNFSTYYERGKIVDFSRPFLLNYVSVLTSTKNTSSVFGTFLNVVLRLVLPIFIVVLVFLLIFSVILSRNKDLSEDRGFMVNSFYVIMAILQGQVTYLQRPHCSSSRLVLTLIAVFSVIFAATFTAVMTDTLLIMEGPLDPFTKIKDVDGKKFVIEEGSGFVDIVESLGGIVTQIPGASGSLDYYYQNRGNYDGYVADHALVNMYDKALPDHDIVQSGINLRNDELVFIINKNFAYAKQIDLGILKLQDNNTSKLICARYLGVDSKLCLL